MDYPIISVIIPAYNVEKYIDKCLASVCSQTFENLDIIIIDDGSTDNTLALCHKWAEKDPRIKILHQKNQGVSQACNVGLEVASGNYIGFVDSDDWIETRMFQELLESIQNTGSDISVCGILMELKNGKVIKRLNFKKNKTTLKQSVALKYLLIDKSEKSYRWNKLYKKELFEGIFFPKDRIFEDLATLHVLYAKAASISYTGNLLYHYVQRENSLVSENNLKKEIDFFLANKERYDFILRYTGFSEQDRKALILRTMQRLLRTDKKIYGITRADAHRAERQMTRETLQDFYYAGYDTKKFIRHLLLNYLQSIPYLYLYQ